MDLGATSCTPTSFLAATRVLCVRTVALSPLPYLRWWMLHHACMHGFTPPQDMHACLGTVRPWRQIQYCINTYVCDVCRRTAYAQYWPLKPTPKKHPSHDSEPPYNCFACCYCILYVAVACVHVWPCFVRPTGSRLLVVTWLVSCDLVSLFRCFLFRSHFVLFLLLIVATLYDYGTLWHDSLCNSSSAYHKALSNGDKKQFLIESPREVRVVFVLRARAQKIWLLLTSSSFP